MYNNVYMKLSPISTCINMIILTKNQISNKIQKKCIAFMYIYELVDSITVLTSNLTWRNFEKKNSVKLDQCVIIS